MPTVCSIVCQAGLAKTFQMVGQLGGNKHQRNSLDELLSEKIGDVRIKELILPVLIPAYNTKRIPHVFTLHSDEGNDGNIKAKMAVAASKPFFIFYFLFFFYFLFLFLFLFFF